MAIADPLSRRSALRIALQGAIGGLRSALVASTTFAVAMLLLTVLRAVLGSAPFLIIIRDAGYIFLLTLAVSLALSLLPSTLVGLVVGTIFFRPNPRRGLGINSARRIGMIAGALTASLISVPLALSSYWLVQSAHDGVVELNVPSLAAFSIYAIIACVAGTLAGRRAGERLLFAAQERLPPAA